jgi:hypothetical protein
MRGRHERTTLCLLRGAVPERKRPDRWRGRVELPELTQKYVSNILLLALFASRSARAACLSACFIGSDDMPHPIAPVRAYSPAGNSRTIIVRSSSLILAAS